MRDAHASLVLFCILVPNELDIVVQVDDVCGGHDQAPQEVFLVGFRLAQVLYTENFADCFAAEDRVVAGDILITQIKAAM